MSDDFFNFGVTYPSPSDLITFVFGNRRRLDHIAWMVQSNGLVNYEMPTPGVMVSLCQDGDGVALDIGANTGLFSLLLAAANEKLQVHAFEPLAPVRDLLIDNISLNPALAPRIKVEPFCLSRTEGSFPFYETINDQGLVTTSSSLELDSAKQQGSYREHTIATRTLDSWAADAGDPPIALVKCDVEGHEHAVLEGGWKTFSRHRPFIVIEVLGDADVAVHNRFASELGYVDFVLASTTLRHCASIRFHPDGWNHLLVPAEKTARVFKLCRQLGLTLTLG